MMNLRPILALTALLAACSGGGISHTVGPELDKAIIAVHEHCAEPDCDALVERLLATRLAEDRGELNGEQRLRVLAALNGASELAYGRIAGMKLAPLAPPSDAEDPLGALQARLTEQADAEAKSFAKWRQPEDLGGRLRGRGWDTEPCIVDLMGPLACEATRGDQKIRVILRKHDVEEEAKRYVTAPDQKGGVVLRDERYTLTAAPLAGHPDLKAVLTSLTSARTTW